VSEEKKEALAAVVAEIEGQLEEATLALQQRDEWKNARAFCDGLEQRVSEAGDDTEGIVDLIREAEAMRDLLSIADTEVSQMAEAAEAGKQERLREDELLLLRLENQGKRYGGLVLVSFVLPIFFMTWPAISRFVLLALIPTLAGFLGTKSVCDELEGRIWLILRARIDAAMSRIRMVHGAAVGSVAAALLWFVFVLVSKDT